MTGPGFVARVRTSVTVWASGPATMRPSTTGATGEWAVTYSIEISSSPSPGWRTSVPALSAVQPSPPVNMKSFVTIRTVSVGPTGVRVPAGPSGAFAMLSTTADAPVQWNVTLSPATCGNRPVAMAELQTGENPLRKPAVSWAPV